MRNFIRRRDIRITRGLLKKTSILYVYKGKSFKEVALTRAKIGHLAGEFSLTKKTGTKIHNSKKNAKKKEKLKNKK